MLGTFWIWYRTSFYLEDGVPMYSNIVKCEQMQSNVEAGKGKQLTLRLSEEQLLRGTSIEKADAGIVTGFIPSINDYVDVFYASGASDTDNPNKWLNIFSGRVVVQPYLPQVNTAIYEIQCVGSELLSNAKTIGNTIQGGVSFENKNNKQIIENLLNAQRDANLKNAQYKIIFDNDVRDKLIQEKGGIRANANQKVSNVLQDILRANQLQLFISKENSGESQTIKYHITDKYYNPDYETPFFTLNHYTCQLAPRIRSQPVKQANRYYYNAGIQTTVDINEKKLSNRSKIFYGDTFFNLSGIAGIINEEKIGNSFIDEQNFNQVKAIRKGNASQVFEKNITDIANKLGFNKVKNDIIASSVLQLRLLVGGVEIPKDLITADGNAFWGKQPALIDVGMRFILELENFNYSQEMLITSVAMSLGNELSINLEVVPVEILNAKQDFFTLPALRSQYKAENGGSEPTALELIEYIYQNPSEPEAKFQLGLLNPIEYGSLKKQNDNNFVYGFNIQTTINIINQKRILTI